MLPGLKASATDIPAATRGIQFVGDIRHKKDVCGIGPQLLDDPGIAVRTFFGTHIGIEESFDLRREIAKQRVLKDHLLRSHASR